MRLATIVFLCLALAGCGDNHHDPGSTGGPPHPVNAERKPKPGWNADLETQWNTLCKFQLEPGGLSDEKIKNLCSCILTQIELDYTPQQVQNADQAGIAALKQSLIAYGKACATQQGIPVSSLPPINF
jgi:hypothetical protein